MEYYLSSVGVYGIMPVEIERDNDGKRYKTQPPEYGYL